MFRLVLLLLALFIWQNHLFAAEGETSQISHNIKIRGIVLVGDRDSVIHENLDQYTGIHFHELTPPGNLTSLRKLLSSVLIGKTINKSVILEGEDAIISHYKKSGHPLVIVYTPNQKVTDGIVQYVVAESRISKISYTGNKWTPTSQLQKNIHQNQGEFFDANLMQEDLIWLNRNPFRDTILVLNPGDEEGTTNINFVSKDNFPYRIYVGADNTGFETTGKERLFAGVRFGNLFHADQSLSYQYTVSTEFGRFYAHTAQYLIPLPWRNILDFYGGYSGIRAIMPTSGMTSTGRAWQASMRYIIPLKSFGKYNHEIKWGVDYKQTDVNIIFNAIPILGNQTVITQAALAYSWSLEYPAVKISSNFQWFISPGDIFPHQSSKDFSSLRDCAKSSYTYIRASLTPIFTLPKNMEIVLKSEFQLANTCLLSSEQFGLGGLYTVRGYDERILNTDNALLLSGEVRSAPLRPFTKTSKKVSHELLQFLAFIDYGCGANNHPSSNVQNFSYLLGIGIGARYHYNHNVSARIDLGIPLHRHIGNSVTQSGGMINFSAILGF